MIEIKTLKPLDSQIVLFGMSCSGKTTFAKSVQGYHYYCFDAMFPWRSIETLDLPPLKALQSVTEQLVENRFVLDGWTLIDKQRRFLSDNVRVYVIYASYERIIDQYRVLVYDREEYRDMYRKWYYDMDYQALNARYFLNDGVFTEVTKEAFNRIAD